MQLQIREIKRYFLRSNKFWGVTGKTNKSCFDLLAYIHSMYVIYKFNPK